MDAGLRVICVCVVQAKQAPITLSEPQFTMSSSSIKGFKVSFAGALIGEETEKHTKWLTQKSLKELLEKSEAHLTKEVRRVAPCHGSFFGAVSRLCGFRVSELTSRDPRSHVDSTFRFPQVNSNTTHVLKGRLDDESGWDKSKKAAAIRDQDEKRKQKSDKASNEAPTATAAGSSEETTPAKKKQKTGDSSKKPVLGPIQVVEFGAFLDEHGLREEWVAAMETADFSEKM